MKNKKYVILEIIPSAISPDKGPIIQLSALKLDGLNLIDRFDYRLNEDKIFFKQLIDIISYDKDSFTYLDSHEKIIDEFKKFVDDLELVIIDNNYTNNYLKDFPNKKSSILDLLNLKYSDDIIDKIIDKYHLTPSNYIVDLLYEALIYESNNIK